MSMFFKSSSASKVFWQAGWCLAAGCGDGGDRGGGNTGDDDTGEAKGEMRVQKSAADTSARVCAENVHHRRVVDPSRRLPDLPESWHLRNQPPLEDVQDVARGSQSVPQVGSLRQAAGKGRELALGRL